jgi:L-threonylcarbamoyladenylate synthase
MTVAPEDIDHAVEILAHGGLVIFPTDTVYGVGASLDQNLAVARLFTVKRRPLSKAIPILLSRPSALQDVAGDLSDSVWLLAARFWPGPLTMVVPASAHLPPILTAGQSTVAVRVPDHPVVRALIEGLGSPLAATSANISGQPSPITAADAMTGLGGQVDFILDGGSCQGGMPSTVVDLTVDPPRILRSGPILIDQIRLAVVPKRSGRRERAAGRSLLDDPGSSSRSGQGV